jgi:SAM-dependent methyltransferase
VARDNLARFPAVTVTEANFETWRPPLGEALDLVFAATAWHWIDPATRYQQAWTLLAPGGHLAFWEASHVFPVDGDPIFDDIQRLYQEIGEGLPPGADQPRPAELPDSRAEIEASGWFEDVATRQFDWSVSYTAAEYLSLLSTFSGHIDMAQWQRDHLYDGIRRMLAQRPDGRLRRHWGVTLHVARRAVP